jgi:hypothetical protein
MPTSRIVTDQPHTSRLYRMISQDIGGLRHNDVAAEPSGFTRSADIQNWIDGRINQPVFTWSGAIHQPQPKNTCNHVVHGALSTRFSDLQDAGRWLSLSYDTGNVMAYTFLQNTGASTVCVCDPVEVEFVTEAFPTYDQIRHHSI